MTRKVGNGLDLAGQKITNHAQTVTAAGDVLSKGAADAIYAALGVTANNLLASSGDVVKQGYKLTGRWGFPLVQTRTVYALMVGLLLPVVGGQQVWTFSELTSSGTRTVIGTVTVADGKVGAVNNLGTPYVIAAGSAIDIQCTSLTAPSTSPGVAPAARMTFYSGTMSLPTAPATPTGVSASLGTGLNTINYTLPSSATDAVIWKNGHPYDVGSGTSYTDTGGLSSDNYAVSAANLGAISTVSSTVTPTASSFSYWTSGARALSADTTDWTVSLGSNSGTSATVDAAGVMNLTSGAAGSNNVNDKVNVLWKGPDGASGTLTALRIKELISPTTTSAIFEYYFRAAGFNTGTTYIQVQVTTGSIRVGGKTGGSFLNWTLTGAANVTCAQQTAGGTVAFSSSAIGTALAGNGTTYYTLMLEVLPVSSVDQSQTIKVYADTAANYANPALWITVVLNSTLTALFSSTGGLFWENTLGVQSATAVSTGINKKTRVLSPLVPVGS